MAYGESIRFLASAGYECVDMRYTNKFFITFVIAVTIPYYTLACAKASSSECFKLKSIESVQSSYSTSPTLVSNNFPASLASPLDLSALTVTQQSWPTVTSNPVASPSSWVGSVAPAAPLPAHGIAGLSVLSVNFWLRLNMLYLLYLIFQGNSNGLLNPSGFDLGSLFILDQLFPL